MPLVEQALAFVWTLAIGMLVGLCYEAYKVIIDTVRLKKIGILAGDLFFWLFITAVAFFMLLHANYGQLRLYVFIGFLTGAFVYIRFLGGYTRKIVRLVLVFIGRIFRLLALFLYYVWRVFTFPFRVVFITFITPLRLIKRGFVYVNGLTEQPKRSFETKFNLLKGVLTEKFKLRR